MLDLAGYQEIDYVITCDLNSPYIVRPLALERYGNGYALVMPDEGAIALSSHWQISPRSLREFLAIALQLVEASHDLTQQALVRAKDRDRSGLGLKRDLEQCLHRRVA